MLEIALVMISIHYGLGRHVVTLEPENAMLAGKVRHREIWLEVDPS